MTDTSPPILSIWSGPAAPECCLASRSPVRKSSERLQAALEETLARRLNGLGSTIYRIGWKPHVTPLGRSISRQRASAPRTSGNEPTSGPSPWPTPRASENVQTNLDEIAALGSSWLGQNRGATVSTMAQLAGWPTPTTRDWKDGGNPDVDVPLNGLLGRVVWLAGWKTPVVNDATGSQYAYSGGDHSKPVLKLPGEAQLAGWPTPVANDDNKTPEAHLAMKKRMGERDGTGADRTAITSLQVMAKFTGPARLTASGDLLTGSCAGMESGGQLNPEHSRWLMGYPAAWGSCGDTAMRSIRTRRPSSSRPSPKPPAFDIFA